MNLGLLLASALWLFPAPAQQGPPSAVPNAPMRDTFIVAAETVIDDASAVDIKADDAHFAGQFQQLKEAQANLNTMADDDREHSIADTMKDLVFQISSCHIQSKDGAPTDKCIAQVTNARNEAMTALNKHKDGNTWVQGPPA